MDRAALPPSWLEELLELLESRRRIAVAAAAAVVALGLFVALVAPDILPATAGVGAAIGIAACLLAVAAVVGVDAGELTVRGARHVRAAGAEVTSVLDGPVDGPRTSGVVARLDELGIRRVALVPADGRRRDRCLALADGLGEAWARAGRRVLVIDLSAADPSHPGIVEVARGEVPLGQAVTFDPEVMLARLGAGAELPTALSELPALAPRLPADIERTVVALPPLTDPAARTGASAVEDVLVVAVADETSRVDLLATLDALDVGGVDAQVLLHRPDRVPATPPAAARRRSADVTARGGERTSPAVARDVSASRAVAAAEGAATQTSGPGDAARPVLAARGRDAAATSDGPPTSAHDGAVRADAPSRPSRDEAVDDDPTQPVPPLEAGSSLLGLERIDQEVAAEVDPHGHAPPTAPGPRARPLRAVASREPAAEPGARSAVPAADLDAPRTAEAQPRPLRAVSGLDRGDGAHEGMVAAAHDDGSPDELATTAVLETLAQEIWSRENIGGTA